MYDVHLELGARMVPFGGWEMPIQYTGVIEEHLATRSQAGLFDCSHMGEIEISGSEALPQVQYLVTNDASKLAIGQAQYAGLCYDNGTFVDDLLVYRLGEQRFYLCVNASNSAKDFAWMCDHKKYNATIENLSDSTALLSLQGPHALKILQPFTETDLSAIKYYWAAEGTLRIDGVGNIPAILSHTGYTGEDGFEIFCEWGQAAAIMRKLIETGKSHGLQPIGLGARDTLRLEAKMALYGNDIDHTTTPLEADLAWIVKFNKGDFIGRDAMLKQKEAGLTRKLVGFEMTGKGIARHGYAIAKDGKEIGHVTSGTFAPSLKKNIGLGYVPLEYANIGATFDVVIRNKAVAATVIPTPFYSRPRG